MIFDAKSAVEKLHANFRRLGANNPKAPGTVTRWVKWKAWRAGLLEGGKPFSMQALNGWVDEYNVALANEIDAHDFPPGVDAQALGAPPVMQYFDAGDDRDLYARASDAVEDAILATANAAERAQAAASAAASDLLPSFGTVFVVALVGAAAAVAFGRASRG